MTEEFTYDSYFKLIRSVMEAGYTLSFFIHQNEDYSLKARKYCVLRHDVDYSVEKAYELANLEHNSGILSTYFFLLTSQEYNILSKKNSDMVVKIWEMGHKIGLHFDEAKYDEWKTRDDFIRNVHKEVEVFGELLGIDIEAVSMHEPSRRLIESDMALGDDMINTYSSFYINKYKYISDSCMLWHEDVDKIITSNKYDNIQLLTHPIWWNEKKNNRKAILENLCETAAEDRRARLAVYYLEDLTN